MIGKIASAPVHAPRGTHNVAPQRSMYDTMRLLGTREWIRDIRLSGGTSIKDAVDATVAFRLIGSGPIAERTFVPASPAAETLMKSPDSTKIQRMVDGILPAFSGRPNQRLQGIIFANTPDQRDAAYGSLVVNQLNSFGMRQVQLGETPVNRKERKDVIGALKVAQKTANFSGIADTAGGWFLVAPRVTEPLMDLVKSPPSRPTDAQFHTAAFATTVMLHEPEHLDVKGGENYVQPPKWMSKVSPNLLGKLPAPILTRMLNAFTPPQMWLEEAGADLLASVDTTRFSQTASRMGLQLDPAKSYQDGLGYPGFSVAMRKLLSWGGMEATTLKGYSQAVQLLQNEAGTAMELPALLARNIAAKQGLDTATEARVKDLIIAAGKGRQQHHAKNLEPSISAIDQIIKQKARQ